MGVRRQSHQSTIAKTRQGNSAGSFNWFQLLGAVFEWPVRFIFGRDIFISYSHADAGQYAPALALALRKEIRNLSFYLDQWIAPPSERLTILLRLQLRWSKLMVVICTDRAIRSEFVKEEIQRFGKFGRQIIPINVDATLSQVDLTEPPWDEIRGTSLEPESLAAVKVGTPAPNVIERISNSVQFSKQAQRLRLAVLATSVFVVGAFIYGNWTVRSANRAARLSEMRRLAAAAKATESEQKAVQFEGRAAAAETATTIAEREAATAKLRASGADASRIRAEEQAGAARHRALTAQAQADREQQIALSRQLAATSLANLDDQLGTAFSFSIQANRVKETTEARRSLLTALQYSPHLSRFVGKHDTE
jgi:hypothetical protein